jgi:hypothetical protein
MSLSGSGREFQRIEASRGATVYFLLPDGDCDAAGLLVNQLAIQLVEIC